jgi:predicted Ser/Thr protein kinase
MIGRTIGKYRIVGRLGRGGSGTVYKAVDETLGREVAIKVLNPDLADTAVMKRFRAEATILARLNHPEIAVIYELFPAETDLLMVMEFVRGETLDKLSDRLGPMPPDHAAYLIDKVLSALEHAHRAGVVHRDMKPANVMVTDGGGVKIMDFGIARVRGADQTTIDSYMMGTPAYMPPEQVLGQEVDGRADLYSVGVMFYRLLTGTLPFSADTAFSMLQRQVSDVPTPLHAYREALPDWCETIVQRALAKSPADRFQSAEEFREALGRATGRVTTTDLAKAFAIQESEIAAASPDMAIAVEPAESRAEGVVAADGVAEAHGISQTADGETMVLRQRNPVRTVAVIAVVAASVVTFVYVALRPAPARPALPAVGAAAKKATAEPIAAIPAPPDVMVAPIAAAKPVPDPFLNPVVSPVESESSGALVRGFPTPLIFDAKALVAIGGKHREVDAQLLLADGRVSVMADGDTQHPLHSVPYDGVISVSYSRGRHPMWRSPKGLAPLARAGSGMLGIHLERHWVSLRTSLGDQFIILRFSDELVGNVLSALRERTGRTPQLLSARKGAG